MPDYQYKAKIEKAVIAHVDRFQAPNDGAREFLLQNHCKDDSMKMIEKENWHPEWCFQTFIVGNSNRHACVVAKAVARQPGKQFNPLLICGRLGCGKTHLMMAIGREIARKTRWKFSPKVCYCTLIWLADEWATPSNIAAVRNADVIMLDSIDWLDRDSLNRIQKGIFLMLDSLVRAGKQVIMTSCIRPKTLGRWFKCWPHSTIVSVGVPDQRQKLKILKHCAVRAGPPYPEDAVLQFLASCKGTGTTCRRMQIAYIRLQSMASLENVPITLHFVKTHRNVIVG